MINQSTHRFESARWAHIAGLFEETKNISSLFVSNFFLIYHVTFEVILVSILRWDWRNLHISFAGSYNFRVHLEQIIGGLVTRLSSSIHNLNQFRFTGSSHFGRKRRVLVERDSTPLLIWQDGVSFLLDFTYFVHSFDCFSLVFRKRGSLFGHAFVKTLACSQSDLFDGNFRESCRERAELVKAVKISSQALLIFTFLLDPRKSGHFVFPHGLICLADSNWVKRVCLHVVTRGDNYFGARFVSWIHKLLNLFLGRVI